MKYDLGFLGGGQLARMSIQAAQRMGLKCLSLDPGAETPASQIAPAVIGSLSDPESVATVIRECRYLTLENEFIPGDAIEKGFELAGRDASDITPSVSTLRMIQDKLVQRNAFERAGVPSPRAIRLDDLLTDRSRMGLPLVLKSRFGGYDGKGTRYARTEEELLQNTADLGSGEGWLAEEFVPFERELAVMVFIDDQVEGTFPTVETVQTNHVCDLVFPCTSDGSQIAIDAVKSLNGKGLFGVELFEKSDGSLFVNEIAPRPHNTGHYSLDWGATSQFEQHVRLAMHLPVDKNPRGLPTCMANLLGVQSDSFDHAEALNRTLGEVGVHVHWYGKAEMKAGRKMGHLNIVGGESLPQRAVKARDLFLGRTK